MRIKTAKWSNRFQKMLQHFSWWRISVHLNLNRKLGNQSKTRMSSNQTLVIRKIKLWIHKLKVRRNKHSSSWKVHKWATILICHSNQLKTQRRRVRAPQKAMIASNRIRCSSQRTFTMIVWRKKNIVNRNRKSDWRRWRLTTQPSQPDLSMNESLDQLSNRLINKMIIK